MRFVKKKNKINIVIENFELDLEELAIKFGTPLEIEFPFLVRKNIEKIFSLFREFSRESFVLFYFYPIKVNPRKEILQQVFSFKDRVGFEVGNEYELSLLFRNFLTKLKNRIIVCHGNKSPQYLSLIRNFKTKTRIIPVAESLEEIYNLKGFEEVGIRINTGKNDRFGIEKEKIVKVKKILKSQISVLHFHIGTQVKNLPFRIRRVFSEIRKILNFFFKNGFLSENLIIDVGGGLAVSKNVDYDISKYIKTLIESYNFLRLRDENFKVSFALETGRWVVAPSQITIFAVELTKNKKGRNVYVTDGSFITDLPDTWGVGEEWEIIPINFLKRRRIKVLLEGKTLDNDDYYIKNKPIPVSLPIVKKGEKLFICIKNTGAYQEGLGNHHCLLPDSNKVILYENGKIELVRKKSIKEVEKFFGY